jgi:hypothetical protein
MNVTNEEDEISIFYDIFHAVILKEIHKITWELDKKGYVDLLVDENGEITVRPTEKGIQELKNYPEDFFDF